MDTLDGAVIAAFAEILRQAPAAIDCSNKNDLTNVLVFDGIDLRLVISAALDAVNQQTPPSNPGAEID